MENLEDQANRDQTKPFSGHFHEPNRGEKANATLKAVPKCADCGLIFLRHELHHVQEANICSDRIEETKCKQNCAKEVNVLREHYTQIQKQHQDAIVRNDRLASECIP